MNERIMIVDDDPSIIYTVRAVLDGASMGSVTANGGLECLEHLANGFSGLILLDVMMPGMNGWQTAEEIVAQGYASNTLICMLTAQADPDEGMEEIKAYIVDYITKPFTPDDLLDRVRQYISLLPV